MNKENWPIAYRWAAMGALVVYSAIGSKTYNVANAQELPVPVPAKPSSIQAPQAVLQYDIAPGMLNEVLPAFARVAGLNVTTATPAMGAVASPGASGLFTPEQALRKLLANTGLIYRYTSATEVLVELNQVATSIEVTTSADTLATSMPKYSSTPLDTPQTITAVSQTVMQQQAATTLRDSLRNVAGISLAAGEGGAQGDNLTIRGFTARNDLFIDGMRDFGSYYRDSFNTQEVEVLQGPSSVTFGRGSTGGVVNQATKAPGLSQFVAGDMDFGTDATKRGVLDFDHPLPQLGTGAAFRVNVMGNAGRVAGRDVAENRRFGIAPTLSFGLDSATRWTFSYFHQNANDIPDYGVPWLFNGPAPVAHNNYYGFRDGNYLRTYDDIGTAKVEHDINQKIKIRDQVRYANYVRDARITEAQIPAGVTLATPLSTIQVTRNEITVDSVETNLDEQLDLIATVKTGFLQHNIVAGVEGGRETSSPIRPKYTNVPTTSLLDPNPDQPFAGTPNPSTNVHTASITAAAYVLDSINLGKHWDLSGGFRYDRFDTNYTQSVAPVAAFSRVDNMPSWRSALVYKPVSFGSVYVAAGTSFNPSAETLALSAATVGLPPEKNKTYEAGTKWDLNGNRLSIRTAVFQTTKLNAREPDPSNPLLNVLAGTQRVNGVQVEVHARLTSRWDLTSSYANLDAKLVSSQAYPTAVGAQLANVPRNSFNFWSTARLPWRFESGFGGNFASSRTASSTAPFDPVTGLVKEVPGYWVFNAMMSRRLTEHLSVQANVNNLANRYYYDQLHPAHIVLGASRSALIGLKYKF